MSSSIKKIKFHNKKSRIKSGFWSGTESNRRHGDFQSPALPTELPDLVRNCDIYILSIVYVKNIAFFSLILFILSSQMFAQKFEKWEIFEQKGIIQYEEQMYDFADEHLNRALEMNPKAYRSAKYLGFLYHYKEDYNRALTFFLLSLDTNPKQDDAHYMVGEIYDRKMKTAEALSHFKKSIEINDNYYKSHLGCARTESILGNTKQSDYHFNRAFEINREKSMNLFSQARDKRTKKANKSSLALLEKALTLNPAHKEIYFELSSVYRAEKEFESAIRTLERLKYYLPHETKIYVMIANIYYSERVLHRRNNDYQAALFNIERALEFDPDNLQYLELAQELYKLNGMNKEYEETSKKVLRLTLEQFEDTK